ncbi:MAG TPA: TaqI-like C-terminal specificity domain-containing protein, partial [Verrucomicrobiae bacterium]|nr:TaqI-like C-terminal specificity domain-containing protein [Verrucomicrobiae bacterium]
RLEGAGFDAVIGNPPYVRQEGLGDDKPFFEVAHAPVYSGVADLYVYFYHRGLSVCRKGGRFGMITSNKFLRAGYGKALRTFLAGHAVTDIIDFRDLPVFPDATAYPLILVARREPPPEQHRVRGCTVGSMAEASQIEEVMSRQGPSMPIAALREEGWALQRPEVLHLLEKIRAAGRPLGEVIGGKFYYGIKTGYNEAFVIDDAKRAELIAADPNTAEIIKPFLRGRDVKRWRVEWAGLYLIKTEIGVNIKRYPVIFEHLKQYQPALEKRWDKGKYWWELRACDYYAEFEKPTIRYQVIATYQQFAFTNEPYLSNDKTWIIPTDDPTLVAILNSKLAWWFLDHIVAKLQGGAFELRSTYVEQIPVPAIDNKDRRALTEHAKFILAAPDDTGAVAEHEQAINEIVYRLYGLTDHEIALVEGLG